MDVSEWIGLASVGVAVGSAVFAFVQARAAKQQVDLATKQADSAKEQAEAALSQAASAKKQAELMEKQVEAAKESNRIANEVIAEERRSRSLNIHAASTIEESSNGPWFIVIIQNNSQFVVNIQHAYVEFEDDSRYDQILWDGQIEFVKKYSGLQFLPGTLPSGASCRFRIFGNEYHTGAKIPPNYADSRWRKIKNVIVGINNQNFYVKHDAWIQRIESMNNSQQ